MISCINKRFSVIDIGSNSVRLMTADKSSKRKEVIITALAENMGKELLLKPPATERTARAVCYFVKKAKEFSGDNILAFATACCRRAVNGRQFIDRLNRENGINIEIISGETEALASATGALCGKDGVMIDIGGASTEISAYKGGEKLYAKSVDIGAVKLYDLSEDDREAAERIVGEAIKEFGKVPCGKVYAVGGTATSLAAINLKLAEYDPKKVHGARLYTKDLAALCDRLYSLSVSERENISSLQKERAKVIAGGSLILLFAAELSGEEYITVSENDNLEGYLKLKAGEICRDWAIF